MSGSAPVEERWRREIEFHDGVAEHDTRWSGYYEYGLSAAPIQYALSRLGDLGGKTVLDYGSGNGEHTANLAQPGAKVLAFDISRALAQATKARLVASASPGSSFACQTMVAEQLGYASQSIDRILAVSILHHLDLPAALSEVKRVLKPDGRAVFVEPLAHNPIANAYRRLTPDRRSDDERPLEYASLALFEEQFSTFAHREFYVLALLSAGFAFLKSRALFNASLRMLSAPDRALINMLPWARYRKTYGAAAESIDFSHYARPGHERDSIFSCDGARREFGFVPRVDVCTAYELTSPARRGAP